MSLSTYFAKQEEVRHWLAERENASARLELVQIECRCAELISQHRPIAGLKIDRNHLKLVLRYIRHGDMSRLNREFEELENTNGKT